MKTPNNKKNINAEEPEGYSLAALVTISSPQNDNDDTKDDDSLNPISSSAYLKLREATNHLNTFKVQLEELDNAGLGPETVMNELSTSLSSSEFDFRLKKLFNERRIYLKRVNKQLNY